MGSLSGWMEVVILSIFFVGIFGGIVGSFNILYDKNYSFGLSDNTNATQRFVKYIDTGSEQLEGGEVTYDASEGVQLKTSWGLAKDVLDIIWEFLSGGWIVNVIKLLNLGEAGLLLGTGLQIIYVVGLILSTIYAFFKVVW